jgi:hypothetical protein
MKLNQKSADGINVIDDTANKRLENPTTKAIMQLPFLHTPEQVQVTVRPTTFYSFYAQLFFVHSSTACASTVCLSTVCLSIIYLSKKILTDNLSIVQPVFIQSSTVYLSIVCSSTISSLLWTL